MIIDAGTGGGTATGGGTGTTGGGTGTCVPETGEELCADAARACGPLTRTDRCGVNRVVTSCGTCSSPDVCNDGACVCQAETSAQLCTRLAKECGTLTATDNCGNARTVSCGTCSGVESCGGGGVANECGCTPESEAQFCTRVGRACGAVTANDNCGVSRTVASCGSCVSPNTCGSNGQCGCTTETNAQFCTRLGAACGAISGTDACNQPRSVANCGNCSGSNTCGGGGTSNQCGCIPKTAAEMCSTYGKNCGSITVPNGCGTNVQVSCGTCSGPQTCGGGGASNVCGCTAEPNVTFCARVGALCGTVTTADNCGTPRTVTCNSTTCLSPDTCGGGSSPNVCGCTGETEATLCAQLGSGVCGTLQALDGCNVVRTIHCGGCSNSYVCGGAGTPNFCGVPFDGEWNWVVPSVTGENLNAVHAISANDVWVVGEHGTILHWNGSSFSRVNSGTIVGLNDVFATSASDVWVAGDSTVVLHLASDGGWARLAGDAGTGDFTSIWGTSPANMYLAKSNGQSVWRWNGSTWSSTAMASGNVSKISGTSATNIWAAGSEVYAFNGLDWVNRTPINVGTSHSYFTHGLSVQSASEVWVSSEYSSSSPTNNFPVYRFDGGSWADTRVGSTFETSTGALWGSSGGDMWAVPHYPGAKGAYRRVSPGNTWSRIDGGTLQADVHGSSASDVWFVGRVGQVGRWTSGPDITPMMGPQLSGCTVASVVDMTTAFEICDRQLATLNPTTGTFTLSAPVAALATSEAMTGLWAASATQVWVTTSAGQILFFDGTTVGAVATFSGSNFRAIWGTSPTNIWAGTYTGGLLHWDGATWAPAGAPTYARINDIWGSGANDVYAVGAQGGYLHWDGAAWSLVSVTMSPAFYAQKIRASGPGNVWALDGWYGGYVLRFNGSTWQRFTVTGENSLSSLWVAGESDVFMGYQGELYHYNGAGFVKHPVSSQPDHTIWGTGPRELLRFTANGVQRY